MSSGSYTSIYLCTPYSHPLRSVRRKRFQEACRAAASLIAKGYVVYSPIVHSHPLLRYGAPSNWSFWKKQDMHFLSLADEVWVLCLDGWKDSIGVSEELSAAKKLQKPIKYLKVPC